MATTIELRNNYGTYCIEVPKEDMDMGELLDSLIIPMILAAGYSVDTVAQYMDTVHYPMKEVTE